MKTHWHNVQSVASVPWFEVAATVQRYGNQAAVFTQTALNNTFIGAFLARDLVFQAIRHPACIDPPRILNISPLLRRVINVQKRQVLDLGDRSSLE